MEGSLKELEIYSLERAEEMLHDSEQNYKMKQYRTSLNRSYYAVFHSMRAMNTLDGFDSSKHSAVIAHFNRYIIKTGKLEKKFSEVVKKTSYLREKSDYDDFYVASANEAQEQLDNAQEFVQAVKAYLNIIISDGE